MYNGARGRTRTDTVTCFEQVACFLLGYAGEVVRRVRFELTLC
jgi:hypothetical protein